MPATTPDSPVAARLRDEPFTFDFFQAVRLLRELADDRGGVVPSDATARFSAHLSLTFPASAVHDLVPAAEPGEAPRVTVTFLGLFGPSGVLPRYYTDLLLRVEREVKGAERRAVRDWFDLFNHRVTALFYAAWEKYRFVLPFGRGAADREDPEEPDGFTAALYSLVGLGTRRLRSRLRVDAPGAPADAAPLAKVDDLGLLRYAGLLAQQHRTAWGLGELVAGYFGGPVEVQEFQSQWLTLDPPNRSRLGRLDGNSDLGRTAVAGDRVRDIQGKFRVRLGPLPFARFMDFLPDPAADRKAFFLLARVIRLYAGAEFDFDVQLVLEADHVPPCVLDEHAAGPRLGWNCWLQSTPRPRPADDAVFNGELAGRGLAGRGAAG